MPAIPNSLNSSGRFMDGRRRLNPAIAPYASDLATGAGPGALALPSLGGDGGGTGLAVGPSAAYSRPIMRPSLMAPGIGVHHGGGLPAFGGGGGSYGGYGGGPSMGGGSPSFGGFGHQASFRSDRDGSTLAPVSHPEAYHGLDALDAANAEKPKLTSWGADWTSPFESPAHSWDMPHKAEGGPVAPMQPFIAGDPQKDGKPNPELIIPGPDGTHVVPLKDLGKVPKFGDGTMKSAGKGLKPPLSGMEAFHALNPQTPPAAIVEMMKLMGHPELQSPLRLPELPMEARGTAVPLRKYAYGTGFAGPDNGHVNRSDVYDPSFVPSLAPSTGSFGRLESIPAGLEAFDANGNVAGFSTGVAPNLAPAAPMPSAPLPRPSLETPEQYEARRLAMNPQQIDVGFTPRAPLHGFADADALRSNPTGATREERQFSRMGRDLMREARGNPYIAANLLNGRAAAASDAEKMQFEREKESNKVAHQDRETRRKIDVATGYVDDGAGVGQPKSKTVAMQRLEAENANREQTGKRSEEQLRIQQEELAIRQAAEQRAIEEAKRRANPQAGVTQFPGTSLGVPTINGQRVAGAPTLEQTSPGIAPFRVGNLPMPGSPPQFKPISQPVKPSDELAAHKATVQKRTMAYKQALDALKSQEDSETDMTKKAAIQARRMGLLDRQFNEAIQDLNGDGVPDAIQGMGDLHAAESAAPTATPSPSPQNQASAFIASITRKK